MDKVEPALTFTSKPAPTEPVPFEIDGERFFCRPFLSGGAFLRYARMMSQGGLVLTGAVEDFFGEVMEPDEHERFRKFIDAPERYIEGQLLGEVFLALFARLSAGKDEETRPTKPSRRSQSGRGPTSDTSKEASGSEASTQTG